MEYQVAYISPLDGKLYRLRRVYPDLNSAASAADDLNVGEPCIHHWAEPVQSEQPSAISNVDLGVSKQSLIIQN